MLIFIIDLSRLFQWKPTHPCRAQIVIILFPNASHDSRSCPFTYSRSQPWAEKHPQHTRCTGVQVDTWTSWNPPSSQVFLLDSYLQDCSLFLLVSLLLSSAIALICSWEELPATKYCKLPHSQCVWDYWRARCWPQPPKAVTEAVPACWEHCLHMRMLGSSQSCWQQTAVLLFQGTANKRLSFGEFTCCHLCNAAGVLEMLQDMDGGGQDPCYIQSDRSISGEGTGWSSLPFLLQAFHGISSIHDIYQYIALLCIVSQVYTIRSTIL